MYRLPDDGRDPFIATPYSTPYLAYFVAMGKHVKSKRQTLKHKYKVEKKIRQHNKAVRRASSKNKRDGVISKKKMKKDPGIPNSYPFKMELMEHLEQKRVSEEEKKKLIREARRAAAQANSGPNMSMEEYGKNAAKRTANFDGEDFVDTGNDGFSDIKASGEAEQTRRAFMREFKRVVDAADVILEVLDARDPMGCRCREAERTIVAAEGKRLVLVLNKVDLVPRTVVDKWLAYLRNEYPTVAFRASTGSGGSVGQVKASGVLAAGETIGSSSAMGAENVLQLLKNYSRSRNLKTAISCGIIGYPNVGKSSIINSLKRARAVSVGATPGITKKAQEVKLDKNISLIDCPGIVFADSTAEDALVLRNAVRIEQIFDPISPIETIIKRVGAEPLMVAYSLPKFRNTTEFLALIAKTKGKFRRGGAFDIEAAARMVLGDWNGGKIPFYTLPPKGPQEAQLSASVVNEWGEEFDIKQSKGPAGNEAAPEMFAHAKNADDDEIMKNETAANEKKNGAEEQQYHVAEKKQKQTKNAMEM